MSGSDRILVLGATNRPNDIDSAILRRMPKRFAVGLPNIEQRTKILNLVCSTNSADNTPYDIISFQMLKDTKLSPDFSIQTLAAQTEGLSGSDLRELCRNAAMVPVREFMRSSSGNHDVLLKGQLEVCSNFLCLLPARCPSHLLAALSCRDSICGRWLSPISSLRTPQALYHLETSMHQV